jgi:ATP-dependent Lon protease
MKHKHNTETIDIRSRLPVVPLRDVVVFPHMIFPLLVGRKMTVNALQEAMVRDKQLFLMAQKSPVTESPTPDDLYPIGVVARVLQVMKMPNGTLKVLVEGLVRGEVVRLSAGSGFLTARIEVIAEDKTGYDKETEALSRKVSELFADYIRMNRRIPDEALVSVASIDDYSQLADIIAAHILHKMDVKQSLLGCFSVRERFQILADVLREEVEILRLEQQIDGNVRDSMSRNQREMYLQQQLKAIKDELGQADDQSADVEDLLAQLSSRPYPEAVRDRAEEEIKRLSRMHPYSAESGVVRGYVEWLLALPWDVTTGDRTDFSEVQSILDGDHFGLEKAKKRIVEHLAVIRLAGKVKGPILCLVGPPGVGKTSVGKSIARAMGRKFVRMSLGGIHDEAEIRGHRRTYIGAMPGRIVQSLKKTESANPVFLLDEVDKIGKDFRGDPAAALLEVLDPEQNSTFSDNYLELECDLSSILFVTTANTIGPIPPALRDRMEIIRLPGYLDFEKVAIARDFLFPKLKKEMGLQKVKIDLREDALREIIRFYTRESGVRELERQLAAMLRKTAVGLANGKRVRSAMYNRARVNRLLGPRKYVDTDLKTKPTVGYAVGLAWTEMGGEALPVEVVPMKGKSNLTLTGSLGEVMRESAAAALSYIRKQADRFELPNDFYEKLDIHVHIPEGATPKDGPSAGITLTVAMLSSLTGIPVRTDIAMTGEITLTGDVLPIGGLNEKLLAAKRNGITEVVIPEKNRKDVVELPAELLDGLSLRFVRQIDDVIKLVMTEQPYIRSRQRARAGRTAGHPH